MAPRLLAIAGFIVLLATPTAHADGLSAGPMVGAVDHDWALIWASGTSTDSMKVRVQKGQDAPRTFGTTPFDLARDLTATVRITDLEPETTYTYEVLVNDKVVGGKHTLRTLPRPGTGKVRLAFGSCLKVGFAPEQPIFDVIADAKPDAFLWLGDNCYYTRTDTSQAERLWKRMRGARSLPSLRRLLASTPNLAQWDDHDYGPNNSDRTYRFKKDARAVFMAYWANRTYGQGGEGIYSKISLGPVDLFLCDNRWFRDPNHTADSPTKGILGRKQRDWLIEGLAASKAPIKIVATGVQFLARYHEFESFDTVRHERDGIVAAIRDKKIQGVMFISGDRHLAEVVRWRGATQGLGYDLWDVTSSPLSNRSWPDGAEQKNPEREFSYGDTPNFGWIEVDANAKTVTLEVRGADGKRLWSATPTDLFPGR